MDLIDVVQVARRFNEAAGWGYFKVISIKGDPEKGEWTLIADIGALTENLMYFTIDDVTRKVIHYKSKKDE